MSTKILPFLVPLLASALCSSKQYCDKDSCQPKCQNIRQISEKTPSILFKKARGRLGNQLNAYAMLLQLKKDYGYDTYLLQESYDILAKVFTKESIEIPVLEQSFCDISKLHIQVFDGNFTEITDDKSPHLKGKIYSLFPPKEQAVFVPTMTTKYRKSRNQLYLYLREHLKIHPKYVQKARETLKKVAKKLKLPMQQIHFVGIHHRRTDIEAFAKKAFNEKPVKKSFFYDAMDYFRDDEDYDPVAFLYVSDDPKWGKKNLKNKHKDLFFVGRGNGSDEDDVGHDFALLVHSNHSVTTLGSFSRWVSILNGGDTYGTYGPVIRSISNLIHM